MEIITNRSFDLGASLAFGEVSDMDGSRGVVLQFYFTGNFAVLSLDELYDIGRVGRELAGAGTFDDLGEMRVDAGLLRCYGEDDVDVVIFGHLVHKQL